MNANIYHINWGTLIKMFTPSLVRRPKLFAGAVALLKPSVLEYGRWLAWAADAVYRVSHNGSMVSLTAVLNDKFNAENWRELPDDERIFIKNIQQQDALRFYSLGAQKEVGFYSAPNQQNGFRSFFIFDDSRADFTVHVPLALQPAAPELEENLLIRMRGQIDYYKLFEKNYKILWY